MNGTRSLMYMLGMLVLIAAVAYGAFLLGAPLVWIGLGALALLGLALMSAASSPRGTDTGGPHEIHHHHGA